MIDSRRNDKQDSVARKRVTAEELIVVVILFGVSGAGKTTIGRTLASELGWSFYDADDFHPPANLAKMSSGAPLQDVDRAPWLDLLRGKIVEVLEAKKNAVLACSALKESYRRRLQVNAEVKLVYLRGSYSLIEKQLHRRPGHFMKKNLLHSQFEELEEPAPEEGALVIEIGRPVSELVDEISRTILGRWHNPRA